MHLKKTINILLVLTFVGCKQNNNYINANEFTFASITYEYNTKTDSLQPIKCSYSSDTTDNQLTFDIAIIKLKTIIDSVNTKHGNNSATAKYMNSLLLADFVYANCAFQFLGSLYQKSSSVAIYDWQNLSLKQMFQKANSNNVAVWCGDRTTYYQKLVKYLLNTEVTSVSINKVHTYPIVTINGLKYIIDPYFPLVIINPKTNHIADYDWLKKSIEKNDVTFRLSPRYFGESKTLISSELLGYMKSISSQKDTQICYLVNNLITSKMNELLALRKSKNSPMVTYNATINPLKNMNYPFAFNTNITEPLTNKDAFCKQYGL